ncbi:MAG: hypothetical protein PVJ52_03090 [Candidatus Woesebacteria bacterium]|jgi:TRAP-type C4-dicarboxylate transport system permease small subunit
MQLAQDSVNLTPPGDSGFANLTNISFSALISYGIQLVLVIAAIVFFFILVIGGIKWITSGGDKGQTEAARNQITAALVGLVIVFSAWAIIQIIQVLFGVNILGGLDLSPTP